MNLDLVTHNLFKSVSQKLGMTEQTDLSPAFLRELAKQFHMKERARGISVHDFLAKMTDFGLDVSHLEVAKLQAGDKLHKYFFLDLANVLLDSIHKAKASRLERLLGNGSSSSGELRHKSRNLKDETSGGEEVARILGVRNKTVTRKGLENADLSIIPKVGQPNNLAAEGFPHAQPQQAVASRVAYTNKDLTDGINGQLKYFDQKLSEKISAKNSNKTKYQSTVEESDISVDKPRKKVRKKFKTKTDENLTTIRDIGEENISPIRNESEMANVDVRIPTSDNTDIVLTVKPLESKANQRIHVWVKEKTPQPYKARKITYGSKSVISHHLRKTRPPMFSKKLATPKLDKKSVIRKALSEIQKANAVEDDAKKTADLDKRLQLQKLLREKRTTNAQLAKLLHQ